MYTQVMLVLSLIDAQYLQNVVFSFEEGLYGQNHSFSDTHHPIKNFFSKIHHPPPFNAIWKTMGV